MANVEDDFGQDLMSWQIPEIPSYQRGPWWFLLTGLIALGFVIYGFYSSNYLFIFIIILIVVIAVINHFRTSELVDVVITTEGIQVDTAFYDYDMIKNFSVIYKPRDQVKALYLEFNNVIRPRLTIPLNEANPVRVRSQLLKFLMENLDRTDEPNTDYLSKKLKI